MVELFKGCWLWFLELLLLRLHSKLVLLKFFNHDRLINFILIHLVFRLICLIFVGIFLIKFKLLNFVPKWRWRARSRWNSRLFKEHLGRSLCTIRIVAVALSCDHLVHHLRVGEIAFVHLIYYRSHEVTFVRADVVLQRLIADVAANTHIRLSLN